MKKIGALVTILLILIVSVVISFIYLDRPISAFFHYYPVPGADTFFKGISFLGNPNLILMVGVIFVILGLYGTFKKTILPAWNWFFWGGTTLVTGAIVWLVKNIVCRSRPDAFLEEQVYGYSLFCFDWASFSFPSGHVAMATALGLSAMVLFKHPWINLLVVFYIPLVALSRVVVVDHFFSDVLGGVAVGIIVVFVMKALFNLFVITSENEREKNESE